MYGMQPMLSSIKNALARARNRFANLSGPSRLTVAVSAFVVAILLLLWIFDKIFLFLMAITLAFSARVWATCGGGGGGGVGGAMAPEQTYPVPWHVQAPQDPPITAGLVVYWVPSSAEEFQNRDVNRRGRRARRVTDFSRRSRRTLRFSFGRQVNVASGQHYVVREEV